ncbi:MAG: class I SAM-dependent methyltransferase, partial [Solirubrobacteraceae bacterium]
MPISKGSRLATYARRHDGSIQALPIQRWLDPADAVDEHILRRVRGPVLDVGCGPGRHLHALARRGVFALGVDISSAAVARARSGGATAIVASIFDELP